MDHIAILRPGSLLLREIERIRLEAAKAERNR